MDTDLPPEPPAAHSAIKQAPAFARDVTLTAFAVDSYCLGPHWVYDTERIKEIYPNGLKSLDAPQSDYHPNKEAGDLTHYGDQMLVLLESIAESRQWEQKEWMEDWLAFWNSEPNSYLDGATADVLSAWKLENEPIASHSHDLAGASRIAPLLSLLADEPIDVVVKSVREQTASTHNNPEVIDASELFARTAFHLREGIRTRDAFEQAITEGNYQSAIEEQFKEALSFVGKSDEAAWRNFGQSCDVSGALPLTIWLALTYPDAPQQLLESNALIGGDNSARGMLLAILIAAKGQYRDLPPEWTAELNELARIDAALDSIIAEN